MWQIQAALAKLAEASGDGDGAEGYRQGAQQTLETIAGRISDPQLRESFRARVDF
jgi:hypothetical protein